MTEWRRGAGTGGGLGRLRSEGQVVLGGGSPDWGSEVASALVGPAPSGTGSPLGAQPGPLFANPAMSVHTHTHKHTWKTQIHL